MITNCMLRLIFQTRRRSRKKTLKILHLFTPGTDHALKLSQLITISMGGYFSCGIFLLADNDAIVGNSIECWWRQGQISIIFEDERSSKVLTVPIHTIVVGTQSKGDKDADQTLNEIFCGRQDLLSNWQLIKLDDQHFFKIIITVLPKPI